MVSETYPSRRVVTNNFEVDGDLAQVNGSFQSQNKTYVGNLSYTSAGAVASLQLGNGRWENTTFNARLQPIQIGLGNSANTQDLWKVNYDYGTTDNNGNVKGQTITVPSQFTAVQNYTYDSLNRLKSATETISGNQTWKQTFTFDRYGNRKFDASQTTTLGNCPVAVCNPDISVNNNRVVGHTFDNSGNTTIDAEGKTFFYDAENKQKEVRNSSNQIIGQYLYDGDGKRVKKISANDTTIFVYDAGGKLASEYLITASQSQAPTTSYLTNDTLGSPRVVTDSSGNVTSRRDFMPYGEEVPRANQGTDKVRQKFTSYERDNETELDFAQARMYANRLGRFTAVDPSGKSISKLDPQSWNRYSYCYNRPLILMDNNGKWPTHIHTKLTEFAFKGLTKRQIHKIDGGNTNTDYFASGKPASTLWTSEAHKHGMTQKGLTKEQAKDKANNFLQDKLNEAIAEQKKFEKAGNTGLSMKALFAVGQAIHLYQDLTSPAHGFDKTYSIPTKTFETTRPDGTTVEYTGTDIAAWKKELEAHSQEESSEPTSEDYAQSALYSRAFFLIAFGEDKFKELEMSDQERRDARKFARDAQKKTQ